MEIIENVITTYYEERDYLFYVNSLIFYEKIPPYSQFRSKDKLKNKSKKLTKKDKERMRKENNKILSLFSNKENYEEVKINGRSV